MSFLDPALWPLFVALCVGAVLVTGTGLFALWILAQLAGLLRSGPDDENKNG
jgi:hypothetical protein